MKQNFYITDYRILGFWGYCDGVAKFDKLYDVDSIVGRHLYIKKISWKIIASNEELETQITDAAKLVTGLHTAFNDAQMVNPRGDRLNDFKLKMWINDQSLMFNQASHGLGVTNEYYPEAYTPFKIDRAGIELSVIARVYDDIGSVANPFAKVWIECYATNHLPMTKERDLIDNEQNWDWSPY